MGTPRGTEFLRAQAFADSLRGLVESLPSQLEKEQFLSQLREVIAFLNDVKERLQAVPAREDVADVRMAISRLDNLFDKAKASPLLAAAVGMSPRPPRPKTQPLGSAEINEAKGSLGRLESLPIDELRALLDQMELRQLQALAGALGIRITSRAAQDVLAHQVATKITNVRGYRSLRDGTDVSVGDERKKPEDE
jgi:hypothetical protein